MSLRCCLLLLQH